MAERAPEVVLVRHGETEWSKSGQHTGRTDIPLTEHGRRQAETVGPRLVDRDFVRVVTSPLQRAAETCRIAGYGDVAERSDDILEWDYGEYEGRKTLDIRKDVPGWTLWSHGVPGGETAQQVTDRLDRFIAGVREADGHVLVFAHGHILRALAARWIGLEVTDGRRFALSTATMSILGYERENPVIIRWNDHWEGGDPT